MAQKCVIKPMLEVEELPECRVMEMELGVSGVEPESIMMYAYALKLGERLLRWLRSKHYYAKLYDNNDGNVETDWKEWKKKHCMCYSPEEDERRKKAWLKTRVTVTEHNRRFIAGEVTSTQGVNQFAALLEGEHPPTGLIMPSEEEMKRLEAEQNVELYDNNDGNVETDWKEWKKKHCMCYSPEEDERRKQAWLKTRVTVTEHNRRFRAGEVTYTQGVNHFAALLEGEHPPMGLIMPSEEEMKRLEAEPNLVGFL